MFGDFPILVVYECIFEMFTFWIIFFFVFCFFYQLYKIDRYQLIFGPAFDSID